MACNGDGEEILRN